MNAPLSPITEDITKAHDGLCLVVSDLSSALRRCHGPHATTQLALIPQLKHVIEARDQLHLLLTLLNEQQGAGEG